MGKLIHITTGKTLDEMTSDALYDRSLCEFANIKYSQIKHGDSKRMREYLHGRYKHKLVEVTDDYRS